MGATTTKRRRASWIAAPLIGIGLIIGGTLSSSAVAASQSAHRTGPALHGPTINRTLLGGIARDLSIHELAAVNRARGVAFPTR